MKTFSDYVQVRENSAIDVGQNVVQKASLSRDQEDSLSSLYALADHMWTEHKEQFMSWLKTFSNDPVVADLVDKIDKDRNPLTQATRKTPEFQDKEEMVPSSADSGGEGEGGQE